MKQKIIFNDFPKKSLLYSFFRITLLIMNESYFVIKFLYPLVIISHTVHSSQLYFLHNFSDIIKTHITLINMLVMQIHH